MEHLLGLLFAISNAFLLPVLVAVLLSFVYATYIVGQFLAEAFDRRTNRRNLQLLYSGKPTLDRFLGLHWKNELGRFQRSVAEYQTERSLLEKQIVDLENWMRRRVERLGIASRTGPILGLVGTLIPLQPALAGLARGDMKTMGANLLIGFTTTVIGLLVGGACYAISVAVRNWYQQDVTEIHFLMAQWWPQPEPQLEATDRRYEPFETMAARAQVAGGRLEIKDRPLRGS